MEADEIDYHRLMENPYKPPRDVAASATAGAHLLSLLFFLLATFCAIGAVVNFATAVLTKLGAFTNVELVTPLWSVAVTNGIVLVVAAIGIVTGIAFRRGRYAYAVVGAVITLVSFVGLFYFD